MSTDESWEEFVTDSEHLLATLDDLPERASDFADSVRERLESMIAWAREREHATPRMWTALRNMQDGVARWSR